MSDPVAVALALLPPWVRWVNLLVWPFVTACVAFLSTLVTARVALRIAGAPGGENWAEAAARAWPVRRAVGLVTLLAGILPLAFAPSFHGAASPLALWQQILLVAAAALLGMLPVHRDLARRLGDPFPRRTLRNLAVALLLFWPNVVILALVVATLPREWNAATFAILAGAVIASWLAGRGDGLAVLALLGIARPPGERLREIVSAMSERMGVAPSAVREIDCGIPNAFVFPLSNRLCFTTRALEVLDDDHARAICAHELGHLLEPAAVRALRLASVMALVPLGAAPTVAVTGGAVWLLVLLAAVVAALTGSLALRRRMEGRADAIAHEHEGGGGTYAAALEKLHEVARMPMVLRGRGQAHGHLYDRMVAAGAPPPYERPAPPARRPTVAGALAGLVVLVALELFTFVGLQVAATRAGFQSGFERGSQHVGIAIRGGNALDFAYLAAARLSEGGAATDAILLYEAASALDPRRPDYPAQRAILLTAGRRCAEARAALAEAEPLRRDDSPDGIVAIAEQAVRGSCANQPPDDSAGPDRFPQVP